MQKDVEDDKEKKMLNGITKWMGTENINKLIRATFDRKVRKDMILNTDQQST